MIQRYLNNKSISFGIIFLVCLVTFGAGIYATTNGPWGFSDATSYIVSARNLLRGAGLGFYQPGGEFIVQTFYPPFYSLMLSAIGLSGVDLIEAARWFNLILLAASLLVAGWTFYRFTSAPSLAVVVTILIAAFPATLWMFTSAMSEPLFVFSIFCSFAFYCFTSRLIRRAI
jgi:hypothetical protein